jgi:glycosyltransferase involved in cell wall biosynthesis
VFVGEDRGAAHYTGELWDLVAGLRVPAGDDAALADKLVRLFAMPAELRKSMGARGRAWVLDHFNAATVAEQLLAVYADVTGAEARERAAA